MVKSGSFSVYFEGSHNLLKDWTLGIREKETSRKAQVSTRETREIVLYLQRSGKLSEGKMEEKNEDFSLRKINIKMNIRHSNDNFK